MRVVRDTADFIEASIHNVEEHLIVGSILAALVVLLFLGNLRSTIISAIAIPTSIIATFGLVWYMGFTLNVMTMLALTLSVGIVIDDAIVVLENIYRFIEEKHENQFEAAVEATREIGLAVLATTLSLVAIFVPVGFMGGFVGRIMKSFGLTMAFAIMVSLLVSFTLTPMLSARWLKVDRGDKGGHGSKDSRLFHAIDVLYTRLLEWSMAHRWVVAVVAVLVLLSSVPLFMLANKNFLPQDDQAEFEINIRAPEGTSLDSTEVITNRVANAMRQHLPEIDYTLVTAGGDPAKTRNLGNIYIRLTPIESRTRDQFAVMNVVRKEVLPPLSANLRTAVQPVAAIGGSGSAADVQFVINGRTCPSSSRSAGRWSTHKTIPGPSIHFTSMKSESGLSVQIDRPRAADLGVPSASGDAPPAVGGDQVTTYNEGGERVKCTGREQKSDDRSHGGRAHGAVGASGPACRWYRRLHSGPAPSDINRLCGRRVWFLRVVARLRRPKSRTRCGRNSRGSTPAATIEARWQADRKNSGAPDRTSSSPS